MNTPRELYDAISNICDGPSLKNIKVLLDSGANPNGRVKVVVNIIDGVYESFDVEYDEVYENKEGTTTITTPMENAVAYYLSNGDKIYKKIIRMLVSYGGSFENISKKIYEDCPRRYNNLKKEMNNF